MRKVHLLGQSFHLETAEQEDRSDQKKCSILIAELNQPESMHRLRVFCSANVKGGRVGGWLGEGNQRILPTSDKSSRRNKKLINGHRQNYVCECT